MLPSHRILCFAGMALAAAPAFAQFSSDPAVNLAVADGPSDQNGISLFPADQGATWVAWQGELATGWDLRLQRLNRAGEEHFAHNGIVVAESTGGAQPKYDLAVEDGQNALLAHMDDSSGTGEITVHKILPDGTRAWGLEGVTVSQGGAVLHSPRIAQIGSGADSRIAVAWNHAMGVKLQLLNTNGAAVWSNPIDFLAPVLTNHTIADMDIAQDAVYLSMFRQDGLSLQVSLVAQALDLDSSPLWGPDPLVLFDRHNVDMTAESTLGLGFGEDLVFTWQTTVPVQQICLQRVSPVGELIWPQGGVAVAHDSHVARTAAHAVYCESQDRMLLAWKDQDVLNGLSGISVQAVGPAGSLHWGDSGSAVVPMDAHELGYPHLIAEGSNRGALVFWTQSSAPDQDRLMGSGVDEAGFVDVLPFPVASTLDRKTEVHVLPGPHYHASLAWVGSLAEAGDVFAQTVHFDGVVDQPFEGPTFCTMGTNNSTGRPAQLTGSWISGNGVGSVLSDLHLEVTQGPPGQMGYLLMGSEPLPAVFVSNGYFCLGGNGARFAQLHKNGTRMNSVGLFNGAGVLVNAYGNSMVGTGFDVPTALPGTLGEGILSGDTWHYQAWYRDTEAGVGSSNFTTAISVTF